MCDNDANIRADIRSTGLRKLFSVPHFMWKLEISKFVVAMNDVIVILIRDRRNFLVCLKYSRLILLTSSL
jgi:hypothetical protein